MSHITTCFPPLVFLWASRATSSSVKHTRHMPPNLTESPAPHKYPRPAVPHVASHTVDTPFGKTPSEGSPHAASQRGRSPSSSSSSPASRRARSERRRLRSDAASMEAMLPFSMLLPWMKRVSPATASDTVWVSTCSYPTFEICGNKQPKAKRN